MQVSKFLSSTVSWINQSIKKLIIRIHCSNTSQKCAFRGHTRFSSIPLSKSLSFSNSRDHGRVRWQRDDVHDDRDAIDFWRNLNVVGQRLYLVFVMLRLVDLRTQPIWLRCVFREATPQERSTSANGAWKILWYNFHYQNSNWLDSTFRDDGK